ncbi:MAG: 23S rRNA (guanosine(2251)-2'-O)-methyltransferase RlmB [Candidatus Adiutrix sp.]|jgi:23S rRNA (guanosine2251-2'-O)-methyltransferase|nr:23S rRNA (guanosine(2251)-2'-O)-methyltransferase RlmB [Candidatus Adiutrix sp.]
MKPKKHRGEWAAPAAEEPGASEAGAASVSENAEAVGGLNAVLAALKARPLACRAVLAAEGRHYNQSFSEIMRLARENRLPLKFSPRQALDRLYGRQHHQGVVAVFDARPHTAFDDFLAVLPPAGPALALALDQVEDPGNLGALMRSALAFGALGVITPRERAAALTPAALAASAGAAEFLPRVRVVNLARALAALKERGFWVVGAEEDERSSLFERELPERTVLVMGSEGRGLGSAARKVCDLFVSIPQDRGRVQSLNVSAAGAIIMCEHFRRFGQAAKFMV